MLTCDLKIDAVGLNCPLPLLKMKQALNRLAPEQTVLVVATDPASIADFNTFINMTPHQLELVIENELFMFFITKKDS